ncbi:MAG TPA: hypothetical protein VF399_01765 [bacterium]
MKILAFIAGVLAAVCLVLSVIARLFFLDKAIFGLSALSYLRSASTMILFAIAFMMFEFLKKKKE